MFLRIVIGLCIAVIGFFITWKSVAVQSFTGRIDWAEQNLSGGTPFFIKLFGIGVSFLGFAIVTNLVSNILTWFASLFVRGL